MMLSRLGLWLRLRLGTLFLAANGVVFYVFCELKFVVGCDLTDYITAAWLTIFLDTCCKLGVILRGSFILYSNGDSSLLRLCYFNFDFIGLLTYEPSNT